MSNLAALKDLIRPVRDRSAAFARPLSGPALSAARRVGGYSAPEYFLEQHRAGRFLGISPWGGSRWLDPPQRAIVPLDERLHIEGTARKLLRRGHFEIRYDTAFPAVLQHCATIRGRAAGGDPWLTPDARQAYLRLHERGVAHSVEAWRDGQLVGGGFGVSINGMYAAQSTFFHEANAGKVARAHLLERLRSRGYLLYDVQVLSGAARPFGAFTIARSEFHALLQEALVADITFH